MSDINEFDLEAGIAHAIDLIDEYKHRISELETAMETFIGNVGKAKNKTELLLAGVVANTRFKELLKEDK